MVMGWIQGCLQGGYGMVKGSKQGVYRIVTGWLWSGEKVVKLDYIVYGLYRLWLVKSLAYITMEISSSKFWPQS